MISRGFKKPISDQPRQFRPEGIHKVSKETTLVDVDWSQAKAAIPPARGTRSLAFGFGAGNPWGAAEKMMAREPLVGASIG